MGWIIWRDEKYLPEHLKFELHYLVHLMRADREWIAY